VFKLPWFIKKIPVNERPKYIYDRLYRCGAKYYATDYSSFEALFTNDIMSAVEFQLYEYMTQNLPNSDSFMKDVREVLGGENVCKFKHYTLKVPATRMSGEMCTSLGNGFSNLMFVAFLCHERGISWEGFVEGDDGLFRFDGEGPKTEDFKKLGLTIKMEEHLSLESASFCGNVFDCEDLVVVTDPREVLASVGWTSSQYVKANKSTLLTLLRAKAWSYGYQYQACPVVSAMARAYLRLTRSFSLDKVLERRGFLSLWERDQLRDAMDAGRPALNRPPPYRTRVLVENLYGISIDTQLAYEKYFDNLEVLEPIPDLGLVVHPSWTDYHRKYVFNADINDPLLEFPSLSYSRLAIRWPFSVARRSEGARN